MVLKRSIRSLLSLKKSWSAKDTVGNEDIVVNMSRSSKMSAASKADPGTIKLIKFNRAKAGLLHDNASLELTVNTSRVFFSRKKLLQFTLQCTR